MAEHSRRRRVAGTRRRTAVPTVVASDAVLTEPEAPRPSRAGRDLKAAVVVSVVLAAVILISLHAYRPSFVAIIMIALGYATYEICTAIARMEARPALFPLLVGGFSILLAGWHEGANGIVIALLISAIVVAVWRLADGAAGYLRDTAASLFVLLYLPFLASFAVLMTVPDDGAARVTAFIVGVACNDIGGYATGVLFWKRPLAPMVSKGKTWEGFAGSIVTGSVVGALIMTLTFHQEWWQGVLFGIALVVVATLGDLGESMIKRDLGLKDMGSLLPGHGGLMDRLDSLLPCAPVAYLLLAAFAPV